MLTKIGEIMEIFEYYKDYGIRYYQYNGTVQIEYYGTVVECFDGVGYGGVELAKEWIDDNE